MSRTRRDLCHRARQLTVERGLSGFTIEELCADVVLTSYSILRLDIDALKAMAREEGVADIDKLNKHKLIFKVLKRGEKLVQSAGFSPSERDKSRTLHPI